MAERTRSDDALDALRSVSHGAVLSIGGIALQKALLFGTNLALTAGLSVGLYGLYALGWRINRLLMRFAPLGSTPTLVRFLPKYAGDADRRDRVLGLAVATTFVGTLGVAAAVFVLADRIAAATLDHPTFPVVLRLFAVLLPFDVAGRLAAFLFRALERIEDQVLVVRVLRPGLRLAGAGAALLFGYSVVGVVAALVVAAALASVVAVWLAVRHTDLRPSLSVGRTEAGEFYRYAGPNTFKTVGQLFRSRVDVLLIGWLLASEAAGIYNVALLLTSLIAVPLVAFNQLLPPVASRLYTRGDYDTLQSVYSTVTRLVVTITVVLAVVEFVYRAQLLALFGGAYVEGTTVLAVFVAGRVAGNAVGATGWLLLMTDHQYVRLLNSWVLAGLNLGFSYVFVLRFGLVGAALGTAGSMALVNLVRLAELWYLEGLQPFDATFLKPAAAGVLMAAAMVALKPVLDGAALLAVGVPVGVLVYGGALFALGVERRDRALVGSLYRSYRAPDSCGSAAEPAD